MASPWKFLARLVSPRREQKENGPNDDGKSKVRTGGDPTETGDDRGVNSEDRPASEERLPDTQFDAVSAEPRLAEETVSSIQRSVSGESAKSFEVAEPASSPDKDFVVEATQDATKSSPTGDVTTRRQSKRRKRAEPVDVVAQSSPVVPTFSDDAMGLDEEIRFLRDQLTRKLRKQNAQLKRMLVRFER